MTRENVSRVPEKGLRTTLTEAERKLLPGIPFERQLKIMRLADFLDKASNDVEQGQKSFAIN